MTYTGAEYSLEDLFQQVKKQAKYEHVKNYEEYLGLVDEMIEDKLSHGFLKDEDDLVQIRHDLELRWSEIAV